AFAAATAYADQAEARGAWDTRMEANVVDAVVRGDTGPELQSQAAALNWDATAPATVIVGLPQQGRSDLSSDDVHDVVARNGRAALSDVHGTWLVAIVSGALGPELTDTLDAYLDSGGAIEACARKLFVHPNTVRYRLKRIADFTGRDPTLPRDAYVLRVAATVGRLGRQGYHPSSLNAFSAAV